MKWSQARAPLGGGAGCILALACVLAGCSSSTSDEGGRPSSSPLSVEVPLDATYSSGAGSEAVVPMGRLGDRLNTFWQLFVRAPGTSQWALVTPTGVADNGGLVVSTAESTGADKGEPTATVSLAGFEPSQDLAFSPLASSSDQGRSWSPGLLPAGLAPVPDAVSASLTAGFVALVREGRGTVLTSAGNLSSWSKLATRDAIASSVAGRSCGVGDLSAVALDPTRGVQVGTTCSSSGLVGVFERAGGTWHLVGPRLSPSKPPASTKVLRLLDVGGGRSALVALRTKTHTGLVGLASTEGGVWSTSTLLPLGSGDRIASTGVEPSGAYVVLVSRSNGSLALDIESGPGANWHTLPAPPPGTATVAVGTGDEVDALAVASTRLTDWRLDASAGTWSKIGTVTVPIQFGSSS